jgi:hypothetical protein
MEHYLFAPGLVYFANAWHGMSKRGELLELLKMQRNSSADRFPKSQGSGAKSALR